MLRTAIKQGNAALKRAEAALVAMKAAQTVAALEPAWSDFLIAADRVYEKLERGKHGKSAGWFGKKIKERKDDPFLSYMHHARNADTHTLEELTMQTRRVALSGSGTYSGVINPQSNSFLMFQPLGNSPLTVTTSTVIKLRHVTDRGQIYHVPEFHLGKPIMVLMRSVPGYRGTPTLDPTPIEAAMLTLHYLRGMLAEAEEYAADEKI